MLEIYLTSQSFAQTNGSIGGDAAQAASRALSLYRRAALSGAISRIVGRIIGRSAGLLDLGSIKRDRSLRGQRYAGLRTVSLGSIAGSEGRTQDFDRDFHPLGSHNRGRWLGIATARLRGVVLPPVSLIQVGEHYFVRDGHHRISVARALGEQYIEAEVIEFDIRREYRLVKATTGLATAQQ